MADTGKQCPLGVNVLGSVLQNTGLTINPVAAGYMGASKTNTDYSFGSLIQNTVLRLLTWAINDGYLRGPGNGNATLTNATYNNLISIGSTTIPALGNAKSPTYIVEDPAGVWTTIAAATATLNGVSPAMQGPATAGYSVSYGNTGQGQDASWIPYDTTNPNASITQWGYFRLHALQAWNEFNWNGNSVTQSTPQYNEFCASFMNANGFITYSNQTINSMNASKTFLQGVYSNMDDLISADISGVTLSCYHFGTDCINLGKIINLADIETFGLPSNLLRNLGKNNAVTQDLSLALIASGLSSTDVALITNGTAQNVSAKQEQQIYGAFLIITGENLLHVLAPMQCNTLGFNTLADVLNPIYLFPNSYASLTVPVYNAEQGLPTNSKTYYLIYDNGGLNNALNTPAIKDYVGTQLPTGTPPTTNNALNPSKYNELPTGFGSYLNNIIPANQAVACGAFSVAMRQIRNIQYFDFQTFARVVQGIENNNGLTLTNGTSLPTNQPLANAGTSICALGTGPNGTYTFSDFFGCMSGLPYAWNLVQDKINQLTTSTLSYIYQQLFLAVTWQPATITVQYTTYTGPGPSYDTYYHVTGVTITNPGGGYGRGNAPAPLITISNGATAIAELGTNDLTAASNGNGYYGRIFNAYLIQSGTDTTSVPTITIEYPPTSNAGGTNTSSGTTGWPNPMNSVVQNYIDQANAEITTIQQNNISASTYLNTYYNQAGVQLKVEQRARYTGFAPVAVPKDYFANPYPITPTTFVDSIPSLSQDTTPHMSAQTLEAISDFTTTGGQSLVAQGRQERNQARLQKLGIGLDNNIPDTLNPADQKTLITNGVLPTTGPGISSPNGNTYTNPAWPTNNTVTGNTITPVPKGQYIPTGFQPTVTTPSDNATAVQPGDITQILNGSNNPVVNPLVPTGPIATKPSNPVVIIQVPPELNPKNLPPNLDPNYTSSTLLPASPSISAAIEQVIVCNCDCWVH